MTSRPSNPSPSAHRPAHRPARRALAAVTAGVLAGGGALLALAPPAMAVPAVGKAVSVTASEYKFAGVPASLPGGLTTITVKNAGKQPHSMEFARIDGTRTDAEIIKVVQSEDDPIPSWIHGAGGIGTVDPGQSASVTLNLRKGTYFAWSSQTDEQAKIDDLKSGMKIRFTVTTDSKAAEPSAPVKIRTKEYGFEVTGLKAGKNVVEVRNVGKELHHVIYGPIAAGKTVADVNKFFASDAPPAGPPPIDFENTRNTAVLDPGVSQIVDIELKAGKYVFFCFITDKTGGPPHVAKGMVQEVVIK